MITTQIGAQSVRDHTVVISASVQTVPPQIRLSWPRDPLIKSLDFYRRDPNTKSWGEPISLALDATNYIDTNVVVGSAWEYRVSKYTGSVVGEGYIQAGVECPLVESRGKVILIVDTTHTNSLVTELRRLQQDLTGDGWTVLRHDVARMAVDPANSSSSVWAARSNELSSVKALIKADYDADPANVKTVFLFGHVPVPYSGDLNPDGHPNHQGAWPADGFYGDIDGHWTDSTVSNNTASDPRNRNVPGDGKFDRDNWPTSGGLAEVELQVGRVDLANLPAFPQPEQELLRQYLNKDHAFRHRWFTMERRGLIDDEFGIAGGEAFAACGWRSFATFFGPINTLAADWLTTLSTQGYLWGYGCGGGTFTSAAGIATTSELAGSDLRVVFTMLFGSYFGDWDSQNNLLRAAIATTNYTLTSVWAGRPMWVVHHMALGGTIGFSTKVTQNNTAANYSVNGFDQEVHIALMGDPTLRMHMLAPPSALLVNTNGAGGVNLRWNPSPEAVGGYNIYRAANVEGPFFRLNSTLINGTNFTDSVIARGTYMVRAVKLEVGGSGSYFNASQGIFQDSAPPGALPLLIVSAQNAHKFYGEPLPPLTTSYSGLANGNTPNDLDTPAILSTSATSSSPAGTYPIHISGATSTNYIITFTDATLTIERATTTGLLTSSANPSLPGRPVTFAVTINSLTLGAGPVTGSVQFRVDGQNLGEPMPLNDGTATYTALTLNPGWHGVEARYAGDSNFSGTSPADIQVVNTPPVAVTDIIERDPTNGVKVLIKTLLNNDSDSDADFIEFLDASPTSANGGTVQWNGDCVFYTPTAGFTNADSFTYMITDGYGLAVTGLVYVIIHSTDAPASKLTIAALTNGTYAIRGSAIPGRTYQIQSTDALGTTNWQRQGTVTGNVSGFFQFTDTTTSTQRFFRSMTP